eukprot:7316721-Alexandrium_andersonii.AAC.1
MGPARRRTTLATKPGMRGTMGETQHNRHHAPKTTTNSVTQKKQKLPRIRFAPGISCQEVF